MNFDELREYVPGDDVKDIDWKATSRSQKVLIRQYIAEKKHNIMLVMDANHRMLGHTKTGEDKGEVALMAGGTLGYMVTDNGDYVSGLYYHDDKMERSPFKTGFLNLELRTLNIVGEIAFKKSKITKGRGFHVGLINPWERLIVQGIEQNAKQFYSVGIVWLPVGSCQCSR